MNLLSNIITITNESPIVSGPRLRKGGRYEWCVKTTEKDAVEEKTKTNKITEKNAVEEKTKRNHSPCKRSLFLPLFSIIYIILIQS